MWVPTRSCGIQIAAQRLWNHPFIYLAFFEPASPSFRDGLSGSLKKKPSSLLHYFVHSSSTHSAFGHFVQIKFKATRRVQEACGQMTKLRLAPRKWQVLINLSSQIYQDTWLTCETKQFRRPFWIWGKERRCLVCESQYRWKYITQSSSSSLEQLKTALIRNISRARTISSTYMLAFLAHDRARGVVEQINCPRRAGLVQ